LGKPSFFLVYCNWGIGFWSFFWGWFLAGILNVVFGACGSVNKSAFSAGLEAAKPTNMFFPPN
jgi:hypothetical protein